MIKILRASAPAGALLLAAAGAAAGPLEYLEAALANSLDLRQAEAQAAAAAESIEVARAGRRPQLRAGGGWRLDGNGPPDADRFTARVIGTQELLNLAAPLEIDLAERRRARAELNVERLGQGILSSTYQAYLRASLAQGSLEVLERREASLQEQLQAAESLFSVGKVNVLQVLNVEAQLAALGAERVAAANALENAVAELEHLAYRDADAIDPLGGGPLDLDPLTFDDWLVGAYGAPDIKIAELDIALARADIERQENALLPSLEFEATLDQRGDATYGVNFAAPLFSSGGASAALRGLERGVEGLEAAADSLRRQKDLELRVALREFRQQGAVAESLRARLAAESRRLEQARASYELDIGLLADALDAEAALAEAELQLAQARHGQLQAYLRLLAASGGMTVAAAAGLEVLFAR